MKTSVRFALRFAAGLVALAIVSALLVPAAPAHGPYVSALSSVGLVSEALAAKNCQNKICNSTSTSCVHMNGFACISHTGCRYTQCGV